MSARMVALLVFLAAACGGDGGSSANGAAQQEETVTITGRVIKIGLDGTCVETVDDVSGTQITFRDGNGNVVGTTEAGPAAENSAEEGILSGCGRTASYTVEVAKADFYVAEALDVELDPISFEDLKTQGFEYDIELGEGLPDFGT